jgi:hypothetical protein
MTNNQKKPGLKIRRKQVGPWGLNAYALVCSETRISVLVDPGAEPDALDKLLAKTEPAAIILTHTHSDHIGAFGRGNRQRFFHSSAVEALSVNISGNSLVKDSFAFVDYFSTLPGSACNNNRIAQVELLTTCRTALCIIGVEFFQIHDKFSFFWIFRCHINLPIRTFHPMMMCVIHEALWKSICSKGLSYHKESYF